MREFVNIFKLVVVFLCQSVNKSTHSIPCFGHLLESDIDEDNLAVFIARYSYDPYQHSPNDCPDAELAFQAGDYLYVFGDIDEV